MILITDIKAAREELAWTQQDLVKHSGVSIATVRRAERSIESCTVKNIKKISETLREYTPDHYVYVAGTYGNTLSKIGHSGDVKTRIINISSSDTNCHLHGVIKCSYWRALGVEKLAHIFLDKFRMRGEWFSISEECAFIALKICYLSLMSAAPRVTQDYYCKEFHQAALRLINDKLDISKDNLSAEKLLILADIHIDDIANKIGVSSSTIRRAL